MRQTARWGALVIVAIVATWGPAHANDGAQPANAVIARGQHVATAIAGCADCHGANFSGGKAFTRGAVTVHAANLTSGDGGIGARSDADLRSEIRLGKRPDGSPLAVMPAMDYALMSDGDVNAVIAYLRSLPAVDNVVPHSTTPPRAGLDATAVVPVEPGITAGAYLARLGGCLNCHGANLGGTVRPTFTAPNISHDGIGAWSFIDFRTAMRTGYTPDGRALATIMPWGTIGKMTDGELRAVYDFLESQPAR